MVSIGYTNHFACKVSAGSLLIGFTHQLARVFKSSQRFSRFHWEFRLLSSKGRHSAARLQRPRRLPSVRPARRVTVPLPASPAWFCGHVPHRLQPKTRPHVSSRNPVLGYTSSYAGLFRIANAIFGSTRFLGDCFGLAAFLSASHALSPAFDSKRQSLFRFHLNDRRLFQSGTPRFSVPTETSHRSDSVWQSWPRLYSPPRQTITLPAVVEYPARFSSVHHRHVPGLGR